MTRSRFGRTSRRQFVASSALGGAAVLTIGQLPPMVNHASGSMVRAQDSSSGVPMFRGNAARTGEMPGPGPDDSNGVEAIWRFTVDDYIPATGRWFYSAPVVANGAIYTGGDDGSAIGNDNGHLSALNADDGTERWRFAIGGSRPKSPVVVDGVAYVGSSDGNLYAVNADDGMERWRFALPGGGFFHGLKTSPSVVDGVAYVGNGDGYLYAIGARVPRLSVGGTARVTESTPLRGGPAPTAVERVELTTDTAVTIVGDSESTSDIIWWPVTVDETGDQGWIEASKLEPLTSGPEATATS